MRSRAAVAVALAVLVLTACGARLSERQRLDGIGALGAAGDAEEPGDLGTGLGPGETSALGPGGGGGGDGTGGPGGASAPLPPGGNGGPTDVGVTGRQILIATASDISGVQAGLFKSTHQAISALAAMVNSQGGIYGRALKPLLLDSKADSTANNAAVTQACKSAFALVGSMSAFDNGGAATGEQCGIPDLSAIAVNGVRALAKNVYSAHPVRPDKLAIGPANYVKTHHPEAIKHAAFLYLNAGITKQVANQRVKAYESVGYDFGPPDDRRVYEVQVLEPNYGPYVEDMRNKGVRYVQMAANYQSIVRLLQAMDKADWYPEVRDWDSVVYSPTFLSTGPPAEGSFAYLNSAMLEESASNPEMQRYTYWLKRVAPDAVPDYFGIYAWSAGQLFVKAAKAVGPTLTRKALMAEVQNTHSWDGYGMHVAHDVGGKLMSPCYLYLEVRGGKFVRKDPSSGFICNGGGIVNT